MMGLNHFGVKQNLFRDKCRSNAMQCIAWCGPYFQNKSHNKTTMPNNSNPHNP